LQIGQYHRQNNGVTSKTIKLFVTNGNYYTDSDTVFLSYFDTSFNQNVDPGSFIWAPTTAEGDNAQPTPWRSPQIFEDYWDSSELERGTTVVKLPSGAQSNFTYFSTTATTIENQAFGVERGRK